MNSNKIHDALLEASIALSWATHNHLTSGDAEKYLKIVDDALAEYYEWLLATSTKGEAK